MTLGAQMYTVREYCKTTDGIATSLEKIAQIGYKTVQVSGTCDYDANWLKAELDKNGLKCVITHPDRERIANDTTKLIEEHKVYGCSNIGIGWYNVHETGVDELYNKFINAANEIKDAGLQLNYHNHDHEFKIVEGKTILQQICERFTPEQLKITLDTYWVQSGGGDPAKWIEDLSGRINCIHLKDMAYDKLMMPVGSGNMNFDRIIEKCEKTGINNLLVEQDNCNGEDPFKCLETSYKYLNAMGIE